MKFLKLTPIIESEIEITQSSLASCDPMDCSLPGSSVRGIFQARVLKWVAASFSRGSSRPRIEPGCPVLQADALPSEPPGKPIIVPVKWNSIHFSSVAQSCLTLCDPMNRSMPGLPVHYQLPELTQTHVHRVGEAIQPSHPLSSTSPPAPNPSQHQGLFQ